MGRDENNLLAQDYEIKDSLVQIQRYLETHFNNLTRELNEKNIEIKTLKEELKKVQHMMEGNKQLIDKFLGDISKLQNDIDWYKRTYEQRSFLGTIREKLLRK